MKKSIKNIFFTFFFISMLMSCTSDDNSSEPIQIEIISPETESTYIFGWGAAWPDTQPLEIKAIFTDNQELATVGVSIYTSNGELVFISIIEQLPDNTTTYELNEEFIPDVHGEYSIQFSATGNDGEITESEIIVITYE